MEATYESNKRIARLAACLFFFVCVPTVSWGPGYILSKIFVPRNPAATVNNLLSNEFIFRTGIISHMVSILAFALMTLLLYKLFRPINKHLSLMLIIPAILEVVIVFVLELFHFTALMIMKGEALINVDTSLRQEMVYLLLRIHQYGIGVGQLFWGLWLLPFGFLLKKSGFAPRVIAILTIIGGVGYVADFSLFVLLQRPDYLKIVLLIKLPMFIGLGSSMFWLLIKGVQKEKELITKIE